MAVVDGQYCGDDLITVANSCVVFFRSSGESRMGTDGRGDDWCGDGWDGQK